MTVTVINKLNFDPSVCDDQRVAASSKLNCAMDGPSDESRISLSIVSVFNLFLASVLILFNVKEPPLKVSS